MKRVIPLLLVVLTLLLVAGAASAAPPAQDEGEGQVYIVLPGDALSKLAQRFYGDAKAFTRILEATNALAATDSSYRQIADANVILVGQKLWIPGLTELPAAETPAVELPAEASPSEAASVPVVPPIAQVLLPGTNWRLTSLNGAEPLAGTTITLNFLDETNAAGSAGCNTFRTTYEASEFRISFGTAAGTLIACSEPIAAQETAYLQALEAAQYFELTADGALRLFDANTTMLAEFAPVSQGLAGTTWNVTSYNNGQQAVVGLITGTSMTAVFGEDGQISGSAGCNNYFGPYTTDGGAITIGPLASTQIFCDEEGVMEQEAAFLAALETAATYSISGDTLQMRTADDALAALFSRVE